LYLLCFFTAFEAYLDYFMIVSVPRRYKNPQYKTHSYPPTNHFPPNLPSTTQTLLTLYTYIYNPNSFPQPIIQSSHHPLSPLPESQNPSLITQNSQLKPAHNFVAHRSSRDINNPHIFLIFSQRKGIVAHRIILRYKYSSSAISTPPLWGPITCLLFSSLC